MTKTYSAKMLWQYRIEKGNESKKVRACEEQVVLFKAQSDSKAYSKANKFGKSEEHQVDVDVSRGVKMYFEFVGIRELVELSDWDESGEEEFREVFFEVKDMLEPKERAAKIIPPKGELSVFNTAASKHRRVKLDW